MDSTKHIEQRNSRSGEQIAGMTIIAPEETTHGDGTDVGYRPAVEQKLEPAANASADPSDTAGTAFVADETSPADTVAVLDAQTAEDTVQYASSEADIVPAQQTTETALRDSPEPQTVSSADTKSVSTSDTLLKTEDTAQKPVAGADLTGAQVSQGPIPSIGPDNLDDLLGYIDRNGDEEGAHWTPDPEDGIVYLTVAFPETAYQLPEAYQIAYNIVQQNAFDEEVTNFVPFGQDQIATALDAFAEWQNAVNIQFTVVTPGSSADIYLYGQNFSWAGDLSGSGYSSGVNEDIGSSIRINAESTVWDANEVGGSAKRLFLHEIGHSLGFKHPGLYDADDDEPATYDTAAAYVQDSNQYTVLSYFSGENTGADYNGNSWRPDTLQLHDYYVGQTVYGANWDARSGDTVYGYNASGVSDTYDFTENTAPVLTIWDGNGIDTLDLSGDGSGVALDLRPGTFSSTHGMTENITLAYIPEGAPAGHNGFIENAVGGAGNDTIQGNSQDNVLAGLGGSDTLIGDGGDDHLFGGAGGDNLFGGSGEDELFGGAGDDLLNGGFGVDYFDGGSGSDTVDFSYSNAGWTINLVEYAETHGAAHYNGSVEELIDIENITTGSGNDLIIGSNADNQFKSGSGNDVLSGLNGNDRLEAGGGMDTLFGGDGDDDLFGGDGDDDFYGGDGDDLYIGAGGWDTVHYTDSTKDWTINLSFGSATNTQDSHYFLGNLVPDYDEVLSSIEEVQAGSGDDKLYGDGNVNALYGNDGDDTLFGYGSHDILNGGDGNDHLDGGDGDDILGGGTGFDTASYHYATGGVLVDLAIAGQQDTVAAGFDTLNEIEDLEGSFHDDFLFGDANNNRLEGGAGDDVLTGREGADWLWGEHGDDILLGGEGLDLLYGGDGSDTAAYTFASSSVQVDLSDTGFQETSGAGLDLLNGIENLAGSTHGDFLTGDNAGNTIDGFLGDDLINGLDGGDVINGGFGNDLLIGGLGNDVLDGGAGGDWALYHVGSTSGVVVDLTLGAQNTVGAGVDTLIDIEHLRGSDFGDWLAGDDLSNEILGGGGGDRIFGRSGFDQIDGAQGNDFLFGNQGNDTLTGGAGNDTHWGGLGADTFVFTNNWSDDSIQDFEAGSDVLDFSAVTGVDGFHNLTYTETADGLEIGFDENSVTLANIALIDLTGGDFIL